MEGTRHLVTFDAALGQITAHVPAVAVEYVQGTAGIGEHHESAAESVDAVRFAVPELLGQSQAVPASGEAGHGGAGVDLADLAHAGCPFTMSSTARWLKTMLVPIGFPPPG